MFAGKDIIAISSLGGASGNFGSRILKGRPRLYIHVQLTLLSILNGLDVILLFFIWLGFPYWGRNLGFGGEMRENTCWEGTSLRQTASFESLCVKLSLFVLPVQVRKKKKAGRQEGRSRKKCIFHVYVERPLADGFQPKANVFVSRT